MEACYDQLFDEVFADLKGVECDWRAVCEVLRTAAVRNDTLELPDEVLDMLFRKSASAMGFWEPSAKLLSELRRAMRDRLKEHISEAPIPAEFGDAAQSEDDQTVNEVVLRQISNDVPDEGTVAVPESAVLVGVPLDQAFPGSAVAPTLLTQRGTQPSAKTSNASGFTLQEEEEERAPWKKGSSFVLQEENEGLAPSEDSGFAPPGEIGERAPSKDSGFAPADEDGERKRSKESRGNSKNSCDMVSKRSTDSHAHHLRRGSMVAATLHFVPKYLRMTVIPARALGKKDLLQKMTVSSQFSFRIVLVLLTALQMILYAVYPLFFGGIPKSLTFFGWPLAVAKASAYGACFWTALLFLSMSRDLITLLARSFLVKRSEILRQLVSSSKEIHIFSAGQVMINSCLHTLMHHIGTFVALDQHSGKELNKVLNCAQGPGASMPVGYLGSHQLTSLQFPACPLPETDEKVGYLAGVLSTPGITGYLLMVVILLLGWFSRPKGRRLSFRVFYAMHHLLVTAWVLLLVVHAANDWVGVGVPVVLLISGLPILSYCYTRVKRVYLSCLKIELVNVIRSESGQLLRLDVNLPRSYRRATVGEYAYIKVPEASCTEWHPFTIAGIEDVDGVQRISFIIMAVGTWTKKVHEIIKPRRRGVTNAALHIDGPYFAPAVTIQAHEVVVGIGGGVGVTPFLSFLSHIASDAASNFKRAHIFWTTRTASDYKIMSDLFSKLEERMQTRGGKLVLHLHTTPKGSIWKGNGIGSLFDLATRHIWQKRVESFQRKDSSMIPTIAGYRIPLHAVVVSDILHSGNPVAIPVGRPDFTREFKAVGNQDTDADVGVYVCAGEPVKQSVEEACIACNRSSGTQKFHFNFERFG
ncbi:unnamed protein product [Polarella glacialis]|uniref:FAD-binding FR-type domain-containing protein n=1 Tax=Polarella glacialis TaxID=89957 RepID=A0A813LJW9_POLGL|nr:unnamed protein product [Polarella glacialis]